MLSGGRDSACLLDVAVALRGARACSALHVNYGLRGGVRRGRAPLPELCEQLGVELRGPCARGERAGREAGNLQAWARELRYEAARRGWPSATRRADRDRAHRQRPGRDDPLPAGGLAGTARAAGDARARGPPGPPAAGGHARADGGLLPGAGPALARGREQRRRALRAHARAHGLRAGAARGAPGGGVERAAHGRAAARGDRVARRARGGGAGGSAEHRDRRACASCRRRWRGWSWCAWPRGRGRHLRAPGRRARGGDPRAERAAGGRSCTSGAASGAVIEDGVLAMVEAAAASARAARTQRGTPRTRRPTPRARRHRASPARRARCSSSAARICSGGWRAGGADLARLRRAARCCWWAC